MRFTRLARHAAKNSVVALALLGTTAASALLTMRVVLSAQEVPVPALVARPLAEAGQLAARQGLALRVEGRRHDPETPRDHVSAQEPRPGGTLKSHRSIRVWVSLGARRLHVPALEGTSLRSARLTLDQARLALGRVVEVDDPAPEETILVQHPPAGETDEAGAGVALLVSRGPTGSDYLMPDLIGRDAERVIQALRLVGFKVTDVRYRSYPGVAPGIVLRQSPPAGHRASPRSPVGLDVSRVEP